MKAAMAIKLEKTEEAVLEKMVKAGLFSNRDEAARAAIIKYASDIGIFSPQALWDKITVHKKRKVSPDQLKKDLEAVENET
jgi:Arc/MetJ-type ribon-helix-helix transcriptional regulator